MRYRSAMPRGMAALLLVLLPAAVLAQGGGERGMIRVPDEFEPVAPGVLPSYGSYHALLIGVNRYDATKRSRYPELEGPVQDVRTLRSALEGRLGFRVRTLVDAQVTKKAILEQLDQYKQELQPGDGKRDMGDNLLIWFAGHGEKGADENWNWQWVMPDGVTTLSYREIRSRLREIKARHLLLISDSCFAGGMNPIREYTRKLPAERIKAARERSFQIVSSGDLTTVQDVYKDGSSPFARAVLQQLEAVGPSQPPVAAWELFQGARALVELTSKRVPTFGFDDEEDGFGPAEQQGQFFFVHPRFLRNETAKTRDLGRTGMSRALRDRLEIDTDHRGARAGRAVVRYRLRESRDDAPMVVVGSAQVPLPGREEMEFVPAFLIDVHEVTVGQFRRFLGASGNRTSTRYQNLQGYSDDDQPIVGITLPQAQAYAAWAGKSIPTEAEWYAAAAIRWERGEDGRTLTPTVYERPWDFLDPRPDVKLEWAAFPPPRGAGEQDVSYWGVERMASGVREWCVSLDGDRSFGVVRGGTVVRASSRDRLAVELPPALRRTRADTPRNNLGFRCVVRDSGE